MRHLIHPLMAGLLAVQSAGVMAAEGLSATYVNYDSGQTFSRVDPTIDFGWGGGAPAAGFAGDYFKVTWIGYVTPQFSESYTFTVRSDDGMRLWVGDTIVTSFTGDRSEADSTGVKSLTAGVRTPIRLEYFERTGSASVRLYWQSPSLAKQVIPSASLSTADALRINVGATHASPVSPLCLEADTLPGAELTINGGTGGTNPAPTRLSPTSFYVDLPLATGGTRTIAATSSGVTRSSVVTWTATDINGKSADTYRLNIRAGDSLLLTGAKPGKLIVTRGYGSNELPIGSAGQKTAFKFTQADKYVVTAYDAAGATYGSATVVAATLDIPPEVLASPIKCEVGAVRTMEVKVLPSSEPNTVIFTTDEFMLDVGTATGAGNAKKLELKAAARGKRPLYARLSPGGPILGSAIAEAYRIDYAAARSAHIFKTDPDGTTHARAKLAIFPYTPDLFLYFEMFAHTSTFVGGASKFTIDTSAATNSLGEVGFKKITSPYGEVYGLFEYTIISPPSENQYCHRINIEQTK